MPPLPEGPASVDLVGSLVDLPAAEAVIAEFLAPEAGEREELGVRRSTLEAIFQAGYIAPLETPVQRELAELISRTDATTWFCWIQHQTFARILTSDVQIGPTEVLDGWHEGRMLGAVAIAHVRRPGPPAVVARRVPGGWNVQGRLDFITSWDIADGLFLLAQRDDMDAYVPMLIPAGSGRQPLLAGVEAGDPLSLLAMNGSYTRPIKLSDVVVPDEMCGDSLDGETWRKADVGRTLDANPASFGLVRGALSDLAELAHRSHDADLLEMLELHAEECRVIREHAYSASAIDDRLRYRAESLDLSIRVTTDVIAVGNGRSVLHHSLAEQRFRQAAFIHVLGQTPGTRAAALRLSLAESAHRLADET
jgi:alkylation response protein AidB-like acyl-CoA dehydrogenase